MSDTTQAFYDLLASKAAGTAKYHPEGSKLGDQTVRALFTNPDYPVVAQALADSKWVTAGDSSSSTFLTQLCSEGGPMGKVFTADELVVVSAWINSLSSSEVTEEVQN